MSEESLKRIGRSNERLRSALYTPAGYRDAEDNRMRAYLKSVGIDVDDPKVMERFADNVWPTSHFDDPPLMYQALSPADNLNAGEEAYQRRSDLGRPNLGADATSVANPTLDQLSLRGLYQDSPHPWHIPGLPKRIR